MATFLSYLLLLGTALLNLIIKKIQSLKLRTKILHSPFFSEQWYKKTYKKQLATFVGSSLNHYLGIGWRLGFDPAPNFSTNGYLEAYPDVKESDDCPLAHYILHGIKENRAINSTKQALTLTGENCQNSILFVINAYDKATQKYRVHNFVKPLQGYGWNVKVVQDKDAILAMNAAWDIVVFNRIAAGEALIEAQQQYRNKGGILIYDIDDLIFNPDKARLQDSFKKRDKEGQDIRLAAMARIQSSVLSADLMTVTTDALAQEAKKMGQSAFVIPNSLPSQMPPAVDKQLDIINICYLSGTASHDKDFKECEEAIIKLLSTYDNVVFNLVGELVLCDALSDHERVIRHELMSHNNMLQFLSSMDINLAPLELGNEFTECKSELKIFEAAYYAVPTVASPTAAFADVICHGKNGYLASSTAEWFSSLVLLVEDNAHRNALGNMSQKTIATVFNVNFIAAKLHSFYSYLLAHKERSLGDVSNEQVYEFVCTDKVLQHDVVTHCALFNNVDYVKLYPNLAKIDGAKHYLEYGYKELCKPSYLFDAWWYDVSRGEYNSKNAQYNPVLHALFHAKGNNSHFSTPRAITETKLYLLPQQVKRACLFAGFDADGIIDVTAIKYIAELSKYCEVFYFADCQISDDELDKLSPYVKGAWAERHGNYDFGSYKTLLTEKLGWQAAEAYDEIIFANDSVYLLSDLEHVFSKMDKSDCAWWGMQSTKGMAFTKEHESQNHVNGTTHALNNTLFSGFESTPYYDFLVGSYFIAFRNSVIKDLGFRKIVESISFIDKKKLILDYEVGISRYLIGQNYKLETFVEELHAFHPVYTENLLHLINHTGFPFLKRYLLANNHYFVPQLGKLLNTYNLLNDADVNAHLLRTVGQDVLDKNLNLSLLDAYKSTAFDKLSNTEFKALDDKIIKDPNLWVFPVCYYDHLLTGNDRAVFEQVKNDPRIRKVVLTRSKGIELSGVNVHFYDIDSAEAQQIILRSKNIFLKHGPRINIPYPCEYEQRNFINLWHGIPLKRIGISSVDSNNGDRFKNLVAHNKPNRCVISSSKVDRLAMTAGFYPLTFNEVPITGLPRIDFITMPECDLPEDMQQELNDLRNKLSGKKLALYVPTFRNAQGDAYFEFTEKHLNDLQQVLDENNAVFGVREHMADTSKSYNEVLASIGCLNFSAEKVVNIEMLYRLADVLITDYSSCYIDYLTTRKPVISFAYDLNNYMNEERGFYYDIHEVFPGSVCTEFNSMLIELSHGLNSGVIDKDHYERVRSLFFDYDDQLNSQRVVELVHSLG